VCLSWLTCVHDVLCVLLLFFMLFFFFFSKQKRHTEFAKHTVWVKPEGTASLNVPLDKETQFVAIIGQFYHPDEKSDSWRLVIKRDELEADKPRSIELMRSDLRLLPLKDK
ncbi:type VI secretion lipoprotein TssJ, partial [Escherichia coli]|uniref:type VI secretion lipoprotein TssJ n=1 Tax=Escherichia coli TaxID=562 RepID=UPI00201A31D4